MKYPNINESQESTNSYHQFVNSSNPYIPSPYPPASTIVNDNIKSSNPPSYNASIN